MPVSQSHNVADSSDVVDWNVLVKEVAHRVDEDLPRASPLQRLLKLLGHESQVEALLERVSNTFAVGDGHSAGLRGLASAIVNVYCA